MVNLLNIGIVVLIDFDK